MRQYIGARYVPTFADPVEWDNSHSYEALVMVQHMGDTYTSKKPVPVGIPLTDNTYWVCTGNFNSQVAQIAADLANLASVVEKIPTKRNIILIGDSYVQGVGGNGNDIKNNIASITGWTVKSYYKGGCGYMRAIDGITFGTLLDTAIATETDPESVTDVVIAGSVYNDTASGATVDQYINAIQAIQLKVKTSLPNARLVIVPTWCGYLDSYNTYSVWHCVIQGAGVVGALFPSNSYLWLAINSSYDSGDHIHPSASGYMIISEKIITLLNGKNPGIYTGFNVATTPYNDKVYITADGDSISIRGTLKVPATPGTWYQPFTLPWWSQKANGIIIFRNNDSNDFSDDIRCVISGGIPYIGSQSFSSNTNYTIFGYMPIVDYNYQT